MIGIEIFRKRKREILYVICTFTFVFSHRIFLTIPKDFVDVFLQIFLTSFLTLLYYVFLAKHILNRNISLEGIAILSGSFLVVTALLSMSSLIIDPTGSWVIAAFLIALLCSSLPIV